MAAKTPPKLPITEAVKALRPKHRAVVDTSTETRFSQLLLDHGEKQLQDWAVIAYSSPAKQTTTTSNSNSSCLLYTSPSPRDQRGSRMPSSA